MPSKKKKYNARFPAGRIKKIMQTDEEVGKVAQAVPVIISRTLELFVESLLKKSMQITQARNAKTLTPSHMKQCILSESRFDFLKDLVRKVPDASVQEDNENNALFEASMAFKQDADSADMDDEDDPPVVISEEPNPVGIKPEPHVFDEQSTSSSRTPVIQYAPNSSQPEVKFNFSVNNLLQPDIKESKGHQIVIKVPTSPTNQQKDIPLPAKIPSVDSVPPLIPIAQNFYNQNTSDNLCIDDDYDN